MSNIRPRGSGSMRPHVLAIWVYYITGEITTLEKVIFQHPPPLQQNFVAAHDLPADFIT